MRYPLSFRPDVTERLVVRRVYFASRVTLSPSGERFHGLYLLLYAEGLRVV
ncbi:hypothetical protein A2U01_0103881 [Trifolium medium]|uniref:Uncharacterized protein n=1 Tax=Trifolium medium TaxID=97028 RepID=A0A392V385_9FABA|nr:hypothetical protein [Trifolium medium]